MTLSYFVIKYSHSSKEKKLQNVLDWICGGRRYQLFRGFYLYSSFNISCIYVAKAFIVVFFFQFTHRNEMRYANSIANIQKPCVCHHFELFLWLLRHLPCMLQSQVGHFLLHLWLTLRQTEKFNTLPLFTKQIGHRMTELFENSYIQKYHHLRNCATSQRAALHIMYSNVLNTFPS